MADSQASAENIQNTEKGDAKMSGKNQSTASPSDFLQKTVIDISDMILNQIKAQQCPEWQSEAPSYDYIPRTAKGEESANRIIAKYEHEHDPWEDYGRTCHNDPNVVREQDKG